ncbi:hypothetical protein DIURU_001841 [Diutina rugosa]|uniref:Uncharacterized protein n=1 Tax=Diutina rugosa TaxID=5481 RepID=A0A642UUT0_DIURU|nr:uncharacterized protein DIURU_001841 [Diutina rugosa]KAA8904765.1 hypothetical protein DIURU_001841 [Diutina rugosa]
MLGKLLYECLPQYKQKTIVLREERRRENKEEAMWRERERKQQAIIAKREKKRQQALEAEERKRRQAIEDEERRKQELYQRQSAQLQKRWSLVEAKERKRAEEIRQRLGYKESRRSLERRTRDEMIDQGHRVGSGISRSGSYRLQATR